MYWPHLATALLIAARVWGPAPCGTPAVVWASSQPSDSDLLGWVVPGECAIYLNARSLSSRIAASELRCTVIVHEWGHLTGHGHSVNPLNVMFPTFDYPYWRCLSAKQRHEFVFGRPTL